MRREQAGWQNKLPGDIACSLLMLDSGVGSVGHKSAHAGREVCLLTVNCNRNSGRGKWTLLVTEEEEDLGKFCQLKNEITE